MRVRFLESRVFVLKVREANLDLLCSLEGMKCRPEGERRFSSAKYMLHSRALHVISLSLESARLYQIQNIKCSEIRGQGEEDTVNHAVRVKRDRGGISLKQ